MKVGVARPLTQVGIFVLFFIVPILDLFRMDLMQLRFYVFRKSFSFSEGYILLLSVLLLVFFFVGISKWFGRQFCGWMCPHNTFSVYITKLTSSAKLKHNPGFRQFLNIFLSILFAPVIAFCMIAYFFDPLTLFKDIITFHWTSWAVGAYALLIMFFFIMIYRLRSKFCRNACPYGMFQMILSDKDSSARGFKSMFKGTGLVLLIIVIALVGLLGLSIFTTSGFSASINKKIQGIPAGEFVTYAYGLEIQNNSNKEVQYEVEYEGVPSLWETNLPEYITVDKTATHEETMMFRVDKTSLSQNFSILIKIKSQDGHIIEKKLNIFPVAQK
ncbi:4Fe-4S binding protein [Ammoniphilus sp. CFH 90114]|uniref:4Fe-4S binding protein n=1 Tax=Ammoniphilus sp. CFH 90114 TaxID=2493665 RepID=UPI0013E9478B|nr:4Fe-4S binding protein [Ammoniphilus sp. CFH 90114]